MWLFKKKKKKLLALLDYSPSKYQNSYMHLVLNVFKYAKQQQCGLIIKVFGISLVTLCESLF